MIRRFLAFSSVCALLFVSCSTDSEVLDVPVDPEIPSAPDGECVRVVAQIEPVAPLSRVDVGVDGKGEFVEGDVISLLYNSDQREMKLTSGQWLPALPWKEIGAEASFSAFYPQCDWRLGGDLLHTVAERQDVKPNFEHSDLLFADPMLVGQGDAVNLTFRHLMSCVTVELRGNAFTQEEFQQATVQLKAYNKIEVTRRGTLGRLHDYRVGVQNIPVITFQRKEGTVFQAVVCPQAVNEIDYNNWWLNIRIGGRDFSVKNPPHTLKDGTPFTRFQSGKNIRLIYNFNDTDPVYGNRLCWVAGLERTPHPSSSEWKVFHRQGNYVRKHLPWKATYGWYDCSKKSTNDGSYNDQNLCWAATASNMIHWWYDQHIQELERYFQQHPDKKGTTPLRYISHHDSEVFQVFRENFTDKGSFPKNALNWFFVGRYGSPAGSAVLKHPNTGGYFIDWFGKNADVAQQIGIADRKSLSATLKKAFENKQAIGFSILMAGFGSAHAMTIWGAQFDKAGNVSEIYYTDNNDGVVGQPSIGLISSRVGEYEGSKYPQYRGKACIENSQGKLELPIQDLTLLK